MINIEGAPEVPMCLKYGDRLLGLFPEIRHFEKNGTRHSSLIGRHLESVGRTEPVFDIT